MASREIKPGGLATLDPRLTYGWTKLTEDNAMAEAIVLDEKQAHRGTFLPAFHFGCSAMEWLQHEGRFSPDLASLIGGLSRHLKKGGIPLDRTNLVIRTLHPTVAGGAYVWQAETDAVEVRDLGHDSLSNAAYLNSPVKQIFDGAPAIRRRLADPDCPRDFPILEDLEGSGFTDYLVLPLSFTDGNTYSAAWATKTPGGFDDDAINRILALMPAVALTAEVIAQRDIARNLVNTYLGRSAGMRVLDGAIRRGSKEDIDAVIWYSDLRSFTRMTDQLPTDVLLRLLDDHFEHVAGAVHAGGGDVLKFVGDGMLAIFPIDDQHTASAAANAAFAATRDALVQTADCNKDRGAKGEPLIRFGIGLHRGVVSYGNIGAPDRLDFTVIGPAVNHVARIEGQTRVLERPVLASSTVASCAADSLVSLGFHALRGVREPQELFAPD